MTVYFVSDLHLKPERPDLTRAFSHFLNTTVQDAEELYLLGDIFEAWIGDDTPTPTLEPVFDGLKQLSDQGCKLFFQHGNRDFLVGKDFARTVGAELLPEQLVISLPFGDAVILHGDQLCTDDAEYMQFRTMVRDLKWQDQFLSKPLQERLAIARQLRDASKERTAEKSEYITDVNQNAVNETFTATKVNLMIHGHTHRPHIHKYQIENKECTRIVLGDWDKLGWYLEVSQTGYELISFEIKE
ncbi:MAG: UDP-2,3-diacylglucosamine diphosphatase [Neptuniibacter sp.]